MRSSPSTPAAQEALTWIPFADLIAPAMFLLPPFLRQFLRQRRKGKKPRIFLHDEQLVADAVDGFGEGRDPWRWRRGGHGEHDGDDPDDDPQRRQRSSELVGPDGCERVAERAP